MAVMTDVALGPYSATAMTGIVMPKDRGLTTKTVSQLCPSGRWPRAAPAPIL